MAPLPYPDHTLQIRPWPDTVIDQLGHDPRSAYVEEFWLGVLGPSTTWLLRRLARGLDDHPEGFELDLPETAQALGLGARGGRHSPFLRAIDRTAQFGMAQRHGLEALAVRRKLPPLTRGQVSRLSEPLQSRHQEWQRAHARTPSFEQRRDRARLLAMSLAEMGEGREAAERQLHRWRFHPALASEAITWAWTRHHQAAEAADTGASSSTG